MTRHQTESSITSLKLGVLDFCACYGGSHPQDVLWQSIELASRLERLGYTRYWFSEHHGGGIAHCCPEIMTAVISGVTNTIRVGSGCVLLRHYRPIKVASTFRLLNALYTGRIDLGVGAGSTALLPISNETYADQIRKLVDFVSGRSATPAQPVGTSPPEIWLQGSGQGSVSLAAELGTCFCLGLFLNFSGKSDHKAIIENYRAGFRPSQDLGAPRCNVAVAGICAETEERARRLLEGHRNVLSLIPTVVGNPEQCRNELEKLRLECGIDEIIFLDLCTRFEDRLRSYELLATETGLTLPTDDFELRPRGC